MNKTLCTATCTATLLAALGCFSLPAFAGVVITSETSSGNEKKQKSTVFVEGGKVRMEIEGIVRMVMIFDAGKQVLWIVSPDKGTYTEINSSTPAGGSMAERRQQAMAQSQKQMEEKMAGLPPEQRAQMEQMMKRMTAPSAAPVITYKSTGVTDKVGTFTCSKYEVFNNGKRIAVDCTATLDQMHMTEADFKAFEAFGKFEKERMGSRGASTPAIEELKGYLVHSVSYNGDKQTSEMTVLSVDHKPVDASLFSLPAGVKKEELGAPRPR
jgi:hypothetical protein